MAHQAHEDYHHGMKKPLIGIAGNILVMETGSMPGLMRDYVNHDYSVSVIRAGGIPIIIPPLSDREDILSVLQHIDGLILSGGYDIAPDLYGEEPQLGLGFTMRIVDLFYIEMIQKALAMRLPMLGICKGMQAMNVASGGTLCQDIHRMSGVLQHEQKAPRQFPSHSVSIAPGTQLHRLFGPSLMVNSFHHQAVKEPAPGFIVAATAPDGIPEAIESSRSFALGVQWHPEMMVQSGDDTMLPVFQSLIDNC